MLSFVLSIVSFESCNRMDSGRLLEYAFKLMSAESLQHANIPQKH